jgi:hypothetical protein
VLATLVVSASLIAPIPFAASLGSPRWADRDRADGVLRATCLASWPAIAISALSRDPERRDRAGAMVDDFRSHIWPLRRVDDWDCGPHCGCGCWLERWACRCGPDRL